MPFIDKVKAGAAQAAHKAQEAAKAGQAKIDEAKAKREQDAMFRDLGAAVYAQRSGTADANTSAEIDRLVAALKDHEAAQAEAAAAAAAPAAPSDTSPASGTTTAGDFKLD
jgi:ribosomal protein L12E/L44/L45/RPP1/RPP2